MNPGEYSPGFVLLDAEQQIAVAGIGPAFLVGQGFHFVHQGAQHVHDHDHAIPVVEGHLMGVAALCLGKGALQVVHTAPRTVEQQGQGPGSFNFIICGDIQLFRNLLQNLEQAGLPMDYITFSAFTYQLRDQDELAAPEEPTTLG